ncbi:MAG TPA: hypothetical protein VGU02_16095 [Gaiellaceae bacterium]|nr:hypothetical protein [Gaiellaceae bacterium]
MRTLVVVVVLAGLLAVTASAAPRRTFVWPTSIQAEPDGSLLVVENGTHRVLRVDPRTGAIRVVAGGLAKPFAATRTPRGVVVSDDTALRLVGHGVLTRASSQIGPVAAISGGFAFATQTAAFTLVGGKLAGIATGLAGPHGIAIERGTILIADTGHNRLLAGTHVLAHLKEPRGIAVDSAGRIDVVSAGRIVRLTASGKRLGVVGPRFTDPYDVTVAQDGSLYVIETAARGWLVRVDPRGRVATVPTG